MRRAMGRAMGRVGGKPQAMRDIVKAFRRPPAVRLPDRNGGFPRLSGGPMLVDGAHGFRCPASPRHALLAESLGKPSLWVNIKDLWYYASWLSTSEAAIASSAMM